MRASSYQAGETTKNGFFYMHSDHASTCSGTTSSAQRLGSNSVMSYGQGHPSNLVGKKVPKSCGRYFPYGGTAPRWSVASCLAADLRG
jgi:hypothetical protein